MKKLLSSVVILFVAVMLIATPVLATAENATAVPAQEGTIATEKQILETDNATKFAQMKEEFKSKFAQYEEKYGSAIYGVVALILDTVRIYSIPFCFVGIAVGSIYQYVIGIRRLDTRDKGFALIISFMSILLICQVLPLVFAIVVNGWRG